MTQSLPPHHPATDPWHQIAAFLLLKFDPEKLHVVVNGDDIKAMPHDHVLIAYEERDGVHIRLVDRATALAMNTQFDERHKHGPRV